MRERIKQQYVVIGGFARHEREERKSILLYEGNIRGETLVRVLETMPATTPYQDILAKAEVHAHKLGVRLGRTFSDDEWRGRVKVDAA